MYIQCGCFNCSSSLSEPKLKTSFSQPELLFSRNFQCKKAPHWLSKFLFLVLKMGRNCIWEQDLFSCQKGEFNILEYAHCTNNKRYTFIFGAFRLMRAFTVEKAINFGLEAIGRQTRGTNYRQNLRKQCWFRIFERRRRLLGRRRLL